MLVGFLVKIRGGASQLLGSARAAVCERQHAGGGARPECAALCERCCGAVQVFVAKEHRCFATRTQVRPFAPLASGGGGRLAERGARARPPSGHPTVSAPEVGRGEGAWSQAAQYTQ